MLIDQNLHLKQKCTRFLYHPPKSQKQWLEQLTSSKYSSYDTDVYGESELFSELENRVSTLLNKPAAIFISKGVIAQQIALRVHCENSGKKTVALNQKSHLVVDENDAIQRLSGLTTIHLGADHQPFSVNDLDQLNERPAVVCIELPLRRAGFKAPSMNELVKISDWCKRHQIPLHIDGARLWEVAAGYDCKINEITDLADSVYVSFYKGLAGMGGSIVVGEVDFIDQVNGWTTRYGASIYHMFPYAISAMDGLDSHLPRMSEYVSRAREIALLLNALPGVKATPNPPVTNAFQLYFPGHLAESAELIAKHQHQSDIWIMDSLYETAVTNLLMTEIQIGAGAAEIENAEIIELFSNILPILRLDETIN